MKLVTVDMSCKKDGGKQILTIMCLGSKHFLDFYRFFSIPVIDFFTAGIFYFTAIHLEIKWKKDLLAFFHMEKCFL